MTQLIIATPVRGAEPWASFVTTGYMETRETILNELKALAVPVKVSFNQDVVRARNNLVGVVLKDFPTATHVLWWDDDVWPEDTRIVGEMLATGEDVIAAPYTNKKAPIRWVHNHLNPRGKTIGNVQEMRAVSFGFTITSVSCLRKMWEAGRKYMHYPAKTSQSNLFGLLYDQYEPGAPPELDALMSEDFSFCKRWRDMGGRVTIYLGAGILCHAGMHGYTAREMQGGIK